MSRAGDLRLPMTRRSRSRFSYVRAAVLMVCSFNVKAASPADLEVNVQKNSNSFFVVNSGSKPILILGVKINDRSDCKTGTALGSGSMTGVLTFVPRELKVGDQMLVYNRLGANSSFDDGCKLIRAEVETDQGSKTFTFVPFLSGNEKK
jgi:hypothetical protein